MEESVQKKGVLQEFIQHQKNAAQEAGKAFAALLPAGVKEHGQAAVETSAEGFSLLKNAVKDEVNKGVNRLRTTRNATPTKIRVTLSEEVE